MTPNEITQLGLIITLLLGLFNLFKDLLRNRSLGTLEHGSSMKVLNESVALANHRALEAEQRAESAEKRADEIEKRLIIRPTTNEWIQFVEWAWKQNKNNGQSISAFIDWWVSDEWRRTHAPNRPDVFYVKWLNAFVETQSTLAEKWTTL